MKKIFLTFADSSLRRSLYRIHRQAIAMNTYDKILALTEKDLDPNFKERFNAKLRLGTRGFGYWCWKPQIIYQVMQTMSDGDLLQYSDAGCHLNVRGRARLNEYFEMAWSSPNGVLSFSTKTPEPPLYYDGRELFDYTDGKWTKGDLLDHLGVRHREDILQSPSIGAGIIFFRKCDDSMRLIKKWIDVFSDDFSLIDDTPSKAPNLKEFIEHRHDQSIFSILCKLSNTKTISAYEYYYPLPNTGGPDWESLNLFPIHVKRDKDRGHFLNFIAHVRRCLKPKK